MKRYVLAVLCAGMVGMMPMALATGAAVQREAQKKEVQKGDRPLEKKGEVTPKATAAMLENLLRPETIMKFADQIGLTQEQQQAMRREVQEMRRKLADVQTQLRSDTEALNALLAKEPIDQPAAMGQLDKVLEDERTIKRANLELAISLRSKLTAEQVAKLEDLQKAGAPAEKAGGANAEPVAAVRKGMQEVQELARKKQEAGGDISEVKKLVESVRPLVQVGKYKEALEVLAKAKALLQQPAP